MSDNPDDISPRNASSRVEMAIERLSPRDRVSLLNLALRAPLDQLSAWERQADIRAMQRRG